MGKPVITVYEQSLLRVGHQTPRFVFAEKHLRQLARIRRNLPAGIFRLEYQSLRLGNYVGLIELPEVIIEVLPKIDRANQVIQTRTRWTQLLQEYDFLPRLGNLNPQLLMQPGNLTETLQRSFLHEVTHLTRKGLSRQYRSQRGQQPFLRGKLLLTEQIRTNLVQKHRFYVQAQDHSKDHPLNQRIKQALSIVANSGNFTTRTKLLLPHFQSVSKVSLNSCEAPISLNRVNQHYRNALRLANLICQGYLGGTFAGQDFGFSLLFDMSRVFETVIYYHLRELSQEYSFTLHYQPQKAFWKTKHLRPDFLLDFGAGQRIVIDTKWKVLDYPEPNDEDLRQIFAYTQVFDAPRGILIYPQANYQAPTQTSFNLSSSESYAGEIHFLSIINNTKSQLEKVILRS